MYRVPPQPPPPKVRNQTCNSYALIFSPFVLGPRHPRTLDSKLRSTRPSTPPPPLSHGSMRMRTHSGPYTPMQTQPRAFLPAFLRVCTYRRILAKTEANQAYTHQTREDKYRDKDAHDCMSTVSMCMIIPCHLRANVCVHARSRSAHCSQSATPRQASIAVRKGGGWVAHHQAQGISNMPRVSLQGSGTLSKGFWSSKLVSSKQVCRHICMSVAHSVCPWT